MKICSKCKVNKKNAEYGKSSSSRDGLQAYCKPCKSKFMKQWHAKKNAQMELSEIVYKPKIETLPPKAAPEHVPAPTGYRITELSVDGQHGTTSVKIRKYDEAGLMIAISDDAGYVEIEPGTWTVLRAAIDDLVGTINA